jgi:hypothetical protein
VGFHHSNVRFGYQLSDISAICKYRFAFSSTVTDGQFVHVGSAYKASTAATPAIPAKAWAATVTIGMPPALEEADEAADAADEATEEAALDAEEAALEIALDADAAAEDAALEAEESPEDTAELADEAGMRL